MANVPKWAFMVGFEKLYLLLKIKGPITIDICQR